MSVTPFLLLTMVCVSTTTALNFIMLPMMSASHILRLGWVGKGLIDRGHTVYMIKHNSIPVPSQLLHTEIRFLDYHTREKVHFIITRNCSEMYTSLDDDPGTAVPQLLNFFDHQCDDLLDNEDLFKVMKSLQLDFALVDSFTGLQCFFAIPRRLGIPYAGIGSLPPLESSTTTLNFNYITPTLPIAMVTYPEIPSLKHRLRQWLTIKIMALVVEYRQNNAKLASFLRERPLTSFSDLRQGSSLWLVDSHPMVDVAKPTVPNVVYVGALTTGKPEPLLKRLQDFADAATDGLIIVSFGTVVTHLPEGDFRTILEALNNLTQQVVLATPVDVPNKIRSQIMVEKWIPQNDLLAHPNTKLFITHCGASSQHQAVYHGVPMLGIPFQEEQKANAQRMQAKGFGRYIDRSQLTVHNLNSLIRSIQGDNEMKNVVKRASRIMQDRMLEPEAEAAYWLEHVAKFGSGHLTSYTERLAWFEVLMLDMSAVIALIICLPIALMSAIYRITKTLKSRSGKLKQA